MSRVLMLVINPMTADARVDKEASTLGRAGHDVTVLATLVDGLPAEEERDGYHLRRLPYRRTVKRRILGELERLRAENAERAGALEAARRHPPQQARRLTLALLGVHLLLLFGRRVAARLLWLVGGAFLKTVRSRLLPREYWQGMVRRVPGLLPRCDVIHAHDLGTLAAAVRLSQVWAAAHPDLPRPRVVYDSHELYVEQLTRWTPWEKWSWRLHETRWIRRADVVITVSEGIAAELQRRYRLAVRPVVVLNSPPADARASSDGDVRTDLGLDRATPLAVYVGTVKHGRGVEHLVPALADAAELHLALVGAGADPAVGRITEEAGRRGVAERLHLVPAVPAATLPAYIRTADVGVHPMEPSCRNHELALPNKLFDYVFAGLPVAVTDLPEMAALVRRLDLGTTFDAEDPAAVGQALLSAARGPRPQMTTAVRELAWETQAARLVEVYADLSGWLVPPMGDG